MERKRYYVSVQGKSVLEGQGDAAYEFEINATRAEVDQLQELMNDQWDADDASFFRAFIPGLPYHNDRANDAYDYTLREIYGLIHKLGTKQTKRTIESMGVLEDGKADE
ncbi:hypothetical protein ACFQWB_05875 [Paenibacillus thermoaerophilus]|jgi:hypothetical protein|uniref:Hydrolase n=1 Tax=Paenibacillus thermoaerophilus TaxID=1215385 RepID=A0ABW2V5B0_9BACL|nr:hypothetical protein [Paenibacillus thermoaerophilus]TMV18262.1 hypothetical protein FE781_04775 [Paenibacillus thermoaerophilus]